MNASIAEVDVVPTYKEVTEIDITDTPNPKLKTKTIVGKTVPKSSMEKAMKKKAPNEASTSTGGAKPKTSQPSTSKGNKNKSDGEPWACAICGFESNGSSRVEDHADEACATILIRMLD